MPESQWKCTVCGWHGPYSSTVSSGNSTSTFRKLCPACSSVVLAARVPLPPDEPPAAYARPEAFRRWIYHLVIKPAFNILLGAALVLLSPLVLFAAVLVGARVGILLAAVTIALLALCLLLLALDCFGITYSDVKKRMAS